MKYAFKMWRGKNDPLPVIHEITETRESKGYFGRVIDKGYEDFLIFDTRDEAIRAQGYEQLAALLEKKSAEERFDIYTSAIKRLDRIMPNRSCIAAISGHCYTSITRRLRKDTEVSGRFAAKYVILADRLENLYLDMRRYLPDAGGCHRQRGKLAVVSSRHCRETRGIKRHNTP